MLKLPMLLYLQSFCKSIRQGQYQYYKMMLNRVSGQQTVQKRGRREAEEFISEMYRGTLTGEIR